MKTERRHELQHNELADQLAAWLEKFAPHAKTAGIVAGALLLVFIVYRMSTSGSQEREAASWREYCMAVDDVETTTDRLERLKPGPMNQVIESYPGTLPAAWARLRLAEDQLQAGLDLLFTNRNQGLEELEKAQKNFELLTTEAKQFDEQPRTLLTRRAALGLAKSLEGQSSGDLAPAVKEYKELEAKTSVGAYGRVAKTRELALASDEASTFYTWFHEYNPQKTITPGVQSPGTQPPGVRPDFLEDLLKDDGKSPKAESSKAAETPKTETPATETPKTDAAPSDAAKNDEAKTESKSPESATPAAKTPDAKAPDAK